MIRKVCGTESISDDLDLNGWFKQLECRVSVESDPCSNRTKTFENMKQFDFESVKITERWKNIEVEDYLEIKNYSVGNS